MLVLTQILGFTAGIETSFSAKPAAVAPGGADDSQSKKKKPDAPKEVVVIAPQRAQNLTIAMRRLGKVKASEVVAALLEADLDFLTEDKVDLLQRLSLEEDEVQGLQAAEVMDERLKILKV